jgi:hypothetical protein
LINQQATVFSSITHASQELRGFSDPEQLKYAVQTSALFITHNIRDFYWLHRWWKTLQAWDLLAQPHTGILAVPNSLRLDGIALAIEAFFAQDPLPLIENNMCVFKQNQWIREKW